MLEEDGGPVIESAALILHLADQSLDAGLIGLLGSHERALQSPVVLLRDGRDRSYVDRLESRPARQRAVAVTL